MTEQFTIGFNARRILSVLRSDGPIFRADLARTLDITPSTVRRLTGDLIASGLVAAIRCVTYQCLLCGTNQTLHRT